MVKVHDITQVMFSTESFSIASARFVEDDLPVLYFRLWLRNGETKYLKCKDGTMILLAKFYKLNKKDVLAAHKTEVINKQNLMGVWIKWKELPGYETEEKETQTTFA